MANHRLQLNPTQPADSAWFVGREDILNEWLKGLPEGRFYGVAGGRGMGKSSLLRAAIRLLEQPATNGGRSILPVYLACQRNAKDTAEIVGAIVDALLNAAQKIANVPCPQSLVEETQAAVRNRNLQKAMEHVLDWLFERQKLAYFPVVLLDNAHRILINPSIRQELDSVLQTLVNQKKLGLVMACKKTLREEFAEEFRDNVSPLPLLLTQQFELSPFTLADTRNLMQSLKAHGIRMEKGFAEKLHELSDGHPFRLFFYLDKLHDEDWTLAALRSLCKPSNEKHLDGILQLDSHSAERIKPIAERLPEQPDKPPFHNRDWNRIWPGIAVTIIMLVSLYFVNAFITPLPAILIVAVVILLFVALLSLIVSRLAFIPILGGGMLLILIVGAFTKFDAGLSESGFLEIINKVMEKFSFGSSQQPPTGDSKREPSK